MGIFVSRGQLVMGDPLTLLKRHGKSATLVGDNVVFSEGLKTPIELPKTTITRFRKKKSASDHYTLEALWFCLKSTGIPLGEYVSPQIIAKGASHVAEEALQRARNSIWDFVALTSTLCASLYAIFAHYSNISLFSW